MRKVKSLTKLIDCGVVAVIRADSKEEAMQTSKACVTGGIQGLEITFTVQGAEEVIRDLANEFAHDPDVIVGAGTVLDAITARIAILAGAEFIVSPTFDLETAELCNLYQIPYMPGCMTITEMKEALKAGVDIIKLFPGNTFGPEWIKSVKAPLPQVNIMPTGGVDLDNVDQWIKNGCVAVGVGGNLVKFAKTGEFEKVTEQAKKFVRKVQQARGDKQ